MADATKHDSPEGNGPAPGKPEVLPAAAAPEAAVTPEVAPTAARPAAPPEAAEAAKKPAPAKAESPVKPAAAGAAKAPAAAHRAAPAAPPGPPDPPPPADQAVPTHLQALKSALGGAAQLSLWVGDWTVIVPVDRLLETCRFLRDMADAGFDYCSDVTATDWPTRAERFDVIYCLYSTRLRHRVRVKVRVADGLPVPSVTGLWPAANWLEREVFDLFGISFAGHPDLRRILMPADWQGHPQRKDYPLEGPGELLLESPQEWLKLRQAADEADIKKA
jgi:NADH-quinone oxidoreductase subunit C